MAVSSLKTITKNVYLKLLGASQVSVRDEFMERGGWNLFFDWTADAIAQKNYTLAKDILELLMTTPVTISRSKSNTFILLIEQLWKDCADEEVRSLCKVLLDQWIRSANEQEKGITMATQVIEGEASVSAGEAAVAPLTADGGPGGDVQKSLKVECEEEKSTVVPPNDNHVESDVVQKMGSPPPLVPELQVITASNKVASPILFPSCSSPSSPKKMKPLASSSGSSSCSKKAMNVAACIQDKKDKKREERRIRRLLKRKEIAAAKRREKGSDKQNEKGKEAPGKISWIPPPAASSSSALERGIAKKVSPSPDSNSAVVSEPPKLGKRFKEAAKTKKKGVTKKEKLGEAEQFVLVALGQLPSQVAAVGKELKRNATRDLARIGKNGKPRKKKRREPICHFVKKGICSKGDRSDYLSKGASPSTPANQCKKLFHPSQVKPFDED